MHQQFEYRVVPAPIKGKGGKGIRGREAKFANALSSLMNMLGQDGWEYVRADTLPCEERTGLTTKTTHYHNMLVFRRSAQAAEMAAPQEPMVAELKRLPPPATALAVAPAPEVTVQTSTSVDQPAQATVAPLPTAQPAPAPAPTVVPLSTVSEWAGFQDDGEDATFEDLGVVDLLSTRKSADDNVSPAALHQTAAE